MGNCCTIKKDSSLGDIVASRLVLAIEQNNIVKTREIIEKYTVTNLGIEPVLNINRPIVKLYNHDMNALGYSLFLGHTEIFIMLMEQGRSKLSVMTKLYTEIGKRPVEIMCELGHKNLLEYYMPFYMNKNDDIDEPENLSESISFTKSKHTKSHDEKIKQTNPTHKLTPIQRACEKERLGVLQFIWEYFKEKIAPPEFDVHNQDEITGDNCALVSCKTGNLEIMQFLYEVCRADFHIMNKRRENAIQIMAVWSKKKKEVKFLDCFKFLIEVVNVDYTYEFEETLLILSDKTIVDYLNDRLKNDGISIDKSKLDAKYSLSKNRVASVYDPELLSRLEKAKGPHFNFKELFSVELHQSEEEMSSIPINESLISIQSISQISFINTSKNIE